MHKLFFSVLIFLSSATAFADQYCGQLKKVKSNPAYAVSFDLILPSSELKTIAIHPTEAERVLPLVLSALGNSDVRLCVNTDTMEIELTNLE